MKMLVKAWVYGTIYQCINFSLERSTSQLKFYFQTTRLFLPARLSLHCKVQNQMTFFISISWALRSLFISPQSPPPQIVLGTSTPCLILISCQKAKWFSQMSSSHISTNLFSHVTAFPSSLVSVHNSPASDVLPVPKSRLQLSQRWLALIHWSITPLWVLWACTSMNLSVQWRIMMDLLICHERKPFHFSPILNAQGLDRSVKWADGISRWFCVLFLLISAVDLCLFAVGDPDEENRRQSMCTSLLK